MKTFFFKKKKKKKMVIRYTTGDLEISSDDSDEE